MAKNGYATTKRAKILEYLKLHSDKSVSIKEIEDYLINEINLSISFSTIYRYLDKLALEGTVLKHYNEDNNVSTYQYSKPNLACHNHLHMKCGSCGKIYHMDCSFMEDLKNHIFEHHGFMLECKKSMLYGICDECQKNDMISI